MPRIGVKSTSIANLRGPQGANSSLVGPPGEDGQDSVIPGPPGNAGPPGAAGPQGNPGNGLMLYIEPEQPDDPLIIPGPQGPAGAAGGTGDAAWTNMTLVAPWVAYDATETIYALPSYRKDGQGFVHLRGMAKSGALNATIATLPAGYRPLKRAIFSSYTAGGAGRVDVQNSGVITQVNGGNGFVPFEGITFLAEL